ncbi:MAG: cytochrome P450 [Myxococcota bacterium]
MPSKRAPLATGCEAIDWYKAPLPGDEFHRALRSLREQGPVVRVRALDGQLELFAIVGHAALAEAFKDGECFPPGLAYQIISKPFIGETFMSMDEPGNRRFRPPIMQAFRRRAVESIPDERFAALAHELADRIDAAGEADLCRDFTRIFSFAVLCEMLGLSRDREREFFDWSMELMFGGLDLAASRRADRLFTDHVRPTLEARRAEARDDVVSHLLRVEVDGRRLTDEQVLSHLRLVFTAGATTTADALGNLVHALLVLREPWEACVDDPSLCGPAVDELLRYDPPVASQPRFASAERAVEWAGVEIPAQSPVLFGIAAANRDPEVHRDPDRFDVERRPDDLLTFGPGLRTCPGMHLARKNLRIALEVMTARWPRCRLVDALRGAPRGCLLRGPETLPVRLR